MPVGHVRLFGLPWQVSTRLGKAQGARPRASERLLVPCQQLDFWVRTATRDEAWMIL
jgi:hypothetical protein